MIPESPESFADRLRPATKTEQTFVDPRGRRWIVYERLTAFAGGFEESCLIFESPFAIRRVCVYPKNWMALDKPALERLSWAR
jgi:hypothetical protein